MRPWFERLGPLGAVVTAIILGAATSAITTRDATRDLATAMVGLKEEFAAERARRDAEDRHLAQRMDAAKDHVRALELALVEERARAAAERQAREARDQAFMAWMDRQERRIIQILPRLQSAPSVEPGAETLEARRAP